MDRKIKNCLVCKKELKGRQSKYCSNKCQSKRNHIQKNLPNSDLQVILTGVFGDGCLYKSGTHYNYSTSNVHKGYINFKLNLINGLNKLGPYPINNTGYKKSKIYRMETQSDPKIDEIKNNSLEANLNLLDDLGLAMWFFDDGSLHKKKHFYNLSTHEYSREVHEDLFIPFFKDRWGSKPKLAQERKKDGRHFYYLRFNKTFPTTIISDLLKKYPPSNSYFKRKVI